jgi:hypothetical protein
MSNDIDFVNGLIAKAPNENAPAYVKAKLSIKREELIGWLQSREGEWINAEVKESQGGKWYIAVDSWKPDRDAGRRQPQSQAPARTPQRSAPSSNDFADDDIIF